MKKKITIFCLVASLLIVLDSMNFADALIMFIFAGVIPGTNFQLTPEQSLGLFTISISLIVVYFKSKTSNNTNFSKTKQNQPKTQRLSHV